MFFKSRRRYNGDVAALLPAFRIDLEEAGMFATLEVLDQAWAARFNQYEGALMVAYCFAGGLYNRNEVRRADTFVAENLAPVQNDWVKKGLIRPELVERGKVSLDKRRPTA